MVLSCPAPLQNKLLRVLQSLVLQLTSTRGSAPNTNDTQYPTDIVRRQPRQETNYKVLRSDTSPYYVSLIVVAEVGGKEAQ